MIKLEDLKNGQVVRFANNAHGVIYNDGKDIKILSDNGITLTANDYNDELQCILNNIPDIYQMQVLHQPQASDFDIEVIWKHRDPYVPDLKPEVLYHRYQESVPYDKGKNDMLLYVKNGNVLVHAYFGTSITKTFSTVIVIVSRYNFDETRFDYDHSTALVINPYGSEYLSIVNTIGDILVYLEEKGIIDNSAAAEYYILETK